MASSLPIKGILKNKSKRTCAEAVPAEVKPAVEKREKEAPEPDEEDQQKKSQKWDEMNILATYHPADKDYGLMKIDEPSTPYHRMVGDDDEGAVSDSESNEAIAADDLAQKLAAAEGKDPKIFMREEEESSEEEDEELSPEEEAKKNEFEMKRKIHYNEGMNIKLARQLIATELQEDEEEEEEEEEEEDYRDEEMKDETETEDIHIDLPQGGRVANFCMAAVSHKFIIYSMKSGAAIEEVEGDVSELESKLDKLVKLCIGMIDAGKVYNTANKQFVNGVRELAQQSAKDEVIETSLTKFAESLQEMINYHTDFSNDDTKLEYNVDADNGIAMEGYLFKRASNAFKTWNRRWFSIQNNQLVYQKKFKDNPTVVVEDLRLCTVKHCEDIERRFCFEVVSPTKSCMMQADSEKLRQAWIKAVQNSIATAFREQGESSEKLDRKCSTSTGSLDSGSELKEKSLKGESALQRVECIAGNASCCDCGMAEPRWASINLGITLCIECSGIHRSLGVHLSKVRSLTLDSWEPELLKVMCELGNSVINRIYEANLEELGAKKPQPGDPRQEIEAYIRAKYVEKRFVRKPTAAEQRTKVVSLSRQEKRLSSSSSEYLPPRPPPPTPKMRPASHISAAAACSDEARRESLFCPDELDSLFSYFDTSSKLRSNVPEPAVPEAGKNSAGLVEFKECSPGLQLYWAAFARNLPDMAEALAQGAEVNWVNTEADKQTPLIQAVQGLYWAAFARNLPDMAEALAQGAEVNWVNTEADKQTPLIQAVQGVCLFLKRGASQNAADSDNKTPLSIAVDAANADIVTLLRLAKMNDEMRESEGLYGQPGDETYQDIFRDFSHMASNDPEKLNRFQQYDSHRL
ncbi:UNVERIFIED_CONTAM: hypothetical protein FKN15_060912 [Acipenser sinensis]